MIYLAVACAMIGLSGCAASYYKKEAAVPAQTQADVVIETETKVISIETETEAKGTDITTETTDAGAEATDAETQNASVSNAQQAEKAEPISLLFSGDVLLSNYVLNAYENAGGIQGVLDDGYRQLIEESDFFFVNEEFPFSNRGTQAPDKQYTFRLPPEKVSILQEIGVDGVSLANNHALDFGVDALLDTCDTLDEAGILRTGAGANLDEAKKAVEIEFQDKKIAIIGATRVIPVAEWATHGDNPGMLATYDPTILLKEIKALDEEHDFVIVFVHWGVERAERPEDYQRNMGKMYIDAGADLVIGAHPHVLQGVEYYNGKPIVYSLGNFVFGSSIPKTMLLEVNLDYTEEAEMPKVSMIVHPGTSNSGYTRMLEQETEKQEFYRYLESISYGVAFEDGNVMPQS